jgi:hypothetical protein
MKLRGHSKNIYCKEYFQRLKLCLNFDENVIFFLLFFWEKFELEGTFATI